MLWQRFVSTLCVLSCLSLTACGGKAPEEQHEPAALLLDARGIIMPLAKAEKNVALRPFLPVRKPLAFAVIPPLGGPDLPSTRGIGIEYATPNGDRFVLSQWPKQNYDLNFILRNITSTPCVPVRFMQTNLAWTTKRGLLMTLLPDGTLSGSVLAREAQRLLRHGACTS